MHATCLQMLPNFTQELQSAAARRRCKRNHNYCQKKSPFQYKHIRILFQKFAYLLCIIIINSLPITTQLERSLFQLVCSLHDNDQSAEIADYHRSMIKAASKSTEVSQRSNCSTRRPVSTRFPFTCANANR